MQEDWQDRIVVDPRVLAGKPIVKGTRISVAQIVGHIAGGWTERELLDSYPTLKPGDMAACLAYAYHVLEGEDVFPTAA